MNYQRTGHIKKTVVSDDEHCKNSRWATNIPSYTSLTKSFYFGPWITFSKMPPNEQLVLVKTGHVQSQS